MNTEELKENIKHMHCELKHLMGERLAKDEYLCISYFDPTKTMDNFIVLGLVEIDGDTCIVSSDFNDKLRHLWNMLVGVEKKDNYFKKYVDLFDF